MIQFEPLDTAIPEVATLENLCLDFFIAEPINSFNRQKDREIDYLAHLSWVSLHSNPKIPD